MLGQELAQVFKDEDKTLWDIEDIDITKEMAAREKIETLAPDVIINAAAYNAVDKAEEERVKADLINGYAPGYLAKIADDIKAILVHYSTDYVFEGEKKQGYSEGDGPNPIGVYGASKALGEKKVQENLSRHYIIRLSRLFGKIGAGAGVKKSFVDTMIDLAKTNKELRVIDEEISSPTYAPDLAERTKFVLDSMAPYGIYHAANSGSCTWYEFAKEIFRLKKVDINLIKAKSEDFPRPARRPKFSVLLNTKLPEMRHWTDALAEYLNVNK